MGGATSGQAGARGACDRAANAFRLVLLFAPSLSAWLAFSQSARNDALGLLLGNATCGNSLVTDASPQILGHCLACWSSGAVAGSAALLAVIAAYQLRSWAYVLALRGMI